MDSKELEEYFKRIQMELEERDRRGREEEERREQIRKRILADAERKQAKRTENEIREQLKKSGQIPVSRRLYFRNESREHKTTIEARGGLGGIRIQIFSGLGPQDRRTIGVSLLRSLKPVLRYLRDFEIYHEGEFLSLPRLEARGLPLTRSPEIDTERGRLGFEIRTRRLKIGWTQQELAERASINFKHLSRIELGQVAVSRSVLKRIQSAFDSMFKENYPETDGAES